MECSLKAVVENFGEGLLAIDATGIAHKSFKPGVGPYGEAEAIRLALQHVRTQAPELFSEARTKRMPDVLIPGQWAIEFKILRPFGDNGLPAEHWSENVLHPYAGNTSSLGDCLKLLSLGFPERKAVIIFGYEHTPPRVSLEAAILGFEVLAKEVMKLRLSSRAEE